MRSRARSGPADRAAPFDRGRGYLQRGGAPGTFTWISFLITSGLFAAEHAQWLVGLMAGIAYNLLWYRTRSLKACILAHGVTNLGLAVWVLATGQWNFW